jgi:endonuclease/exonuclease/phosphatase family metal-dependent hydrolase
VGTDGRRDPERILRVLHEIGADVVALQEVDRRFGRRPSVLPRLLVEEAGWQIAPLAMLPDSMGWHGNAILVRRGIEVLGAAPVPLPVIEPRGAVRAELAVDGTRLRVVGAHLDLSGLRRKHQIRAILTEIDGCDEACPAVVLGDFNEWSPRAGSVRQFGSHWQVISPGKSFPSRQPLAPLDRMALSREWRCEAHGVHHSALATFASDHLPIWAEISHG